MAFVYILHCADNTFYVGQTANLDSRVAFHNAGLGCRYTARRRPVALVHFEEFPTHAAARVHERQLKHWSAKKKKALATGDFAALNALSKRRR